MRTHVALLRGINVGGRNKVPMADLRTLAASLGYADVATYVQSGNLVFSSASGRPESIARTLQEGIARHFGFPVDVVVLTRDELVAAAAANPYVAETDPRRVHVLFRSEAASAAVEAALTSAVARAGEAGTRDVAALAGRHVYLWTPGGFGRSDLAARLTRPGALGGTVTARNWATVSALLALLDA